MNTYRFIDTQKADHKITDLCAVLGVPASSYFDWHPGVHVGLDLHPPLREHPQQRRVEPLDLRVPAGNRPPRHAEAGGQFAAQDGLVDEPEQADVAGG